MNLSRRSLLSGISGFAVFACLAELSAFAGNSGGLGIRNNWLQQQGELARGLKSGSLDQEQWQRGVTMLAQEVDLEELAEALRHARIRDAGVPFGHDPRKRIVAFLDEQGVQQQLGYALALFDFRSDSVITPHAHQYMASAHMVLEGKVRIRTFDRLADESDALLIRPTADVIGEPGLAAAMTTVRDNIHWFTPQSATALTLDVIVTGLEPGEDAFRIQPVDPLGGMELGDGSIRAPLISFQRSMELYDATL